MSVYIHIPLDMFRSKSDHPQGLLFVLGLATRKTLQVIV
jgi:hypothetical protein